MEVKVPERRVHGSWTLFLSQSGIARFQICPSLVCLSQYPAGCHVGKLLDSAILYFFYHQTGAGWRWRGFVDVSGWHSVHGDHWKEKAHDGIFTVARPGTPASKGMDPNRLGKQALLLVLQHARCSVSDK